MNRRAQVALFISVGIVLLVGILFFLFAQQEASRFDTTDITEVVPLQMQPIKTFVDDCLEGASAATTAVLGAQGGFINPVDPFLDMGGAYVSYGYYQESNVLPTIAFMEQELANGVVLALQSCTNNFVAFQGAQITADTPEARVTIGPASVEFVVDYPITEQSETGSNTIRKFYYNHPVPVKKIYDIAKSVTADLLEDPTKVDLTTSSSYDALVDYNAFDSENLIVSVTDTRATYGDTPFVFMFANFITLNVPPQIDVDDSYQLTDNTPFTLQVGYLDEGEVTFSDDSIFFDIDDEGIITFTPKITGEFYVRLRVTDEQGLYDEKTVRFDVDP